MTGDAEQDGRRAAWSRRAFLGAAGAAGTAGALATGCGPSDGPRRDPGRAPGAAAPERRAPRAEHDRPGHADWRLRTAGDGRALPGIEGFADRVSVTTGEAFRLHVSCAARSFRAEAFRMGWYGGALARKVWESPTLRGTRQPGPVIDRATYTVSAPWEASAEVGAAGWPEGAYLIRLTADGGAQRYVPLTVRSASTRGRLVLVNAVATWQAYNTWGGHSLYHGPGGKGDGGNRSREVSCDRPYGGRTGADPDDPGDGAGLFLVHERPAIALAERLGLAPAYVTTMDVERDPALLRGATAVITLGHDEYWTQSVFERVRAARDAGTNIAFLGANASFRRVRLEPTSLGARRRVVCWRDDWPKDPDRRAGGPPTTSFREPPHAQPEDALTGALYESNPTTADYVVTSPGHWLFAGTGVARGTSFPGLVGPEYDRVNGSDSTPRPIEVIAHSPLTCRGVRSFADSAYYTTAGGAGVFATGTMRWVGSIAGRGGHGIDARTAAFTSRVTENLLRAFAAGPAGRAHPAVDNLDALDPYVGDPTWTRRDLW
ncbi:N,N-dimethylformamidase beta subunit family domain-containing protein [Streptomyces sp. NPDC050504]|uniref:N,N-dimethylformamidase beta subunit family domain-containing protein n=1 Tax=Streptomyces sp. NPDC050504 TaxID=3365618 RepID=UPI00378DBEE2